MANYRKEYRLKIKENESKRKLQQAIDELKNSIEEADNIIESKLEDIRAYESTNNKNAYERAFNSIKAFCAMKNRFIIMKEDMEFIIAQRNFVKVSQNSLNSMMGVGKEVIKFSQKMDFKKAEKLMDKSMSKLDKMLGKQTDLGKKSKKSFSDSSSKYGVSDEEVNRLIHGEDSQSSNADINKLYQQVMGEESLKPQPNVVKPKVVLSGGVAIEPDNCAEIKQEDKSPEIKEEERGKLAVPIEEDKSAIGHRFNVSGQSKRPVCLDDFMGQPRAVKLFKMALQKSFLTGEVLPHALICGSYGQGKTTLAKIIANEAKCNFVEVSSKIKYSDMLHTLLDLKKGDIIFIDEIHGLDNDIIEQLLYPAMEDFEIRYTERKGARSSNITKKISPFTLIGATTETGLLLKPFYSKFKINCTLEEYSIDTITAIIINSFSKEGMGITEKLAREIAARSRWSPRQANALVEGIAGAVLDRICEEKGINQAGALSSSEARKKLGIQVQEKDIEIYCDIQRIDEKGIKGEEIRILQIIAIDHNGGPVGVDTIARAMNVAVNRIKYEYEPFLIKLGFIGIKNGGRYVTEAGLKYLGLDNGGKSSDNNSATNKEDNSNPEWNNIVNYHNLIQDDELPEYSCEVGDYDERAAGRFNALFSGTSKVFEEPLDELFPDVNKEYDSTALNKCLLKVGKRTIYCDSKLERRFLSYLFEKGFLVDAKSESVELYYSSSVADGKKYYPDFCMKLYDGTIAIVEMKNLSSMGYHLNVDKYETLKSFCNEKGYKFAEIAKDNEANRYISAEEIKNLPINNGLQKFIKNKIQQNNVCCLTDLEEYGYNVIELITILFNDRSLKNIDRTGANPIITTEE